MSAAQTLLLLTLVANSCAISSQYTQVPWYETPPPGGYSNPKKPQGGFCGDIAKEWHELKTHVMSLHGDSAAVEALRHHVHALEQHVHHLEHRGEFSDIYFCTLFLLVF